MKLFTFVLLSAIAIEGMAIVPPQYSVPQDTITQIDTIIESDTINQSENEIELYTTLDSMNYFLGLTMGYSLERFTFKKDPALIAMGLYNALLGTSAYNMEMAQNRVLDIKERLLNQELDSAYQAPNLKREEEQKFLEENAKRSEIHTTASGLQYEILIEGEGPKPAATDTVDVHYEGMFTDGKVFDSSYERGNPIHFPLPQVIAGWREGVQLMPVGSTYKFYVPSKLAYGPRGNGPIPPYSTLIFRISLLGIR